MVKQEDYLRAVVGDPKFWRTCGAYFMCGAPFETDVGSEPLMKQDFNKAQQLMKEAVQWRAGCPDGPDRHSDSAQRFAGDGATKKIGVNVQVQAMDWSTLTSRRAEKKSPAEGGWNLFHTYATGADVSTPIINNGIIGGCEEKAWFGWPCSAEIEKLRDTWARATDLAKQKEIAVELQRLLYEVVPYVNFGQWSFPTAYRKSLKGDCVTCALLLEHHEGRIGGR